MLLRHVPLLSALLLLAEAAPASPPANPGALDLENVAVPAENVGTPVEVDCEQRFSLLFTREWRAAVEQCYLARGAPTARYGHVACLVWPYEQVGPDGSHDPETDCTIGHYAGRFVFTEGDEFGGASVGPCSWGGAIALVGDTYDDYGSEHQYEGFLEACPDGSDGCNPRECRSGNGKVAVTVLEGPSVGAECDAELILVEASRCGGVYRAVRDDHW